MKWSKSWKRQATYQRKRIKYLKGLLLQCEQHCVCSRNTKGFDYGETHGKLGKPESGKRWFTVSDIVDYADGLKGRY